MTIVDLKNGKIKFFLKEDKENEVIYEEEEQIKVEIDNFLKSLFNNPDNFLGMELNETIYELYKTLDNLSNLIKQHNFSLKMMKIKIFNICSRSFLQIYNLIL